jgi:hypothetical protein
MAMGEKRRAGSPGTEGAGMQEGRSEVGMEWEEGTESRWSIRQMEESATSARRGPARDDGWPE